jgi:hypothetical protein
VVLFFVDFFLSSVSQRKTRPVSDPDARKVPDSDRRARICIEQFTCPLYLRTSWKSFNPNNLTRESFVDTSILSVNLRASPLPEKLPRSSKFLLTISFPLSLKLSVTEARFSSLAYFLWYLHKSCFYRSRTFYLLTSRKYIPNYPPYIQHWS